MAINIVRIMNTHKQSISLTLSQMNLGFLEEMSKKWKMSKSSLLDKMIDTYKKQVILKEFSADATLDDDTSIQIIESDFSDYITIVNDER